MGMIWRAVFGHEEGCCTLPGAQMHAFVYVCALMCKIAHEWHVKTSCHKASINLFLLLMFPVLRSSLKALSPHMPCTILHMPWTCPHSMHIPTLRMSHMPCVCPLVVLATLHHPLTCSYFCPDSWRPVAAMAPHDQESPLAPLDGTMDSLAVATRWNYIDAL